MIGLISYLFLVPTLFGYYFSVDICTCLLAWLIPGQMLMWILSRIVMAIVVWIKYGEFEKYWLLKNRLIDAEVVNE
ncbi:MAG: hypothetical protein LBH43_05950 [Treponema sp.]|nr:hypothetical protein [Treponema sp.]